MPKFYKVKAELLTPCCISEQPAMGNEVGTLDYIPGSALRGMLADLYLRNGNDAKDPMFRHLFCSDSVSFPNLYSENCHPLPFSAHTCKHYPGFAFESEVSIEKRKHGVWDLLFEDCEGFSAAVKERRHQTPDCAGPLKPINYKWYDGGEKNPSFPEKYIPKQMLVMRTAVDAPSGSASEGTLHTQQELAAGSTFDGWLVISDNPPPDASASPDSALFGGLSLSLGDRFVAHTGRRRAGQVQLTISEEGPLQQPDPFIDGWLTSKYPDQLHFALTFTSDVILVDRLLRPIPTVDVKTLKNLLSFPGDPFPNDVAVTMRKSFARTRRASGWNAVAQIFKPDDVAIMMGSTFLFSVKRADREKVKDRVIKLVTEGIGLRRSEGFGRVRCHEPFHRAAVLKHGGAL
ncbi:MAG: hypothetical protein IPM66_22295 [Acidobacteriota bacterium]|nr:MAG: hypothetical protein IPM66_22295 [Acidobacteriota bacterium]